MEFDQVLVRNARSAEYDPIGQLLVRVYSGLEGFPSESDQPDYYRMLRCVGDLMNKPKVEIFVATTTESKIVGATVFFGDMRYYGSEGTATLETNSGGFRLLAVDPEYQGKGIGKLLTEFCIKRAAIKKLNQLIIHTTMAMLPAWRMYENLGFRRSEDLDFIQGELPVFGFRLKIEHRSEDILNDDEPFPGWREMA